MEIILTDNLKSFINEKKEDHITLSLPMKKVCCAGPYLPAVKLGRPKNKHEFDELVIDGVHIYKNKKIKYSKPRLHISARKFLFMKEIFVFDPDTICNCSGGEINT
ncbi:MAG: CC/Se motif family (seleno)protein [Sedimentibacter sp.]